MSSFLGRPFVPTFAQQTLLFQLKEEPDKHVFFRAETGTGKSFIMAMWALNLNRSLNDAIVPRPTTTVLIIVPNPDLAIQYHYWISRILSSSFKAMTKIANLAQVFYRGNEDEEERQEQRLRENPHPHVIISTPTRLLDLLHEHAERFDLDHLKYIFFDEADEIIQPPSPTVTKAIRHAQPGEILLDWIWKKRAAATETHQEAQYPRLVAVSSTLSYNFKDYMIERFISKDKLVSKGLQRESAIQPTPRNKTDHFVILVSLNKSDDPTSTPDRIVIQPALLPRATLHDNIRRRPLPSNLREAAEESEYPPNYLAIPAVQRLLRETGVQKALAIVPHGSSKADFVWACQYFGLIGAEELRFNPDALGQGDLHNTRASAENPTVLVAHTKEIRGLDLKGIEMAFIMGEFGTVEDYVHIAGRTGRHHGQRGGVVTIIESTSADVGQKLMNAAVKIIRTGAKLGRWNIPPKIEMDLKSLPGDEFEEIREEKGIVTMTEEVRQKMEREQKAAEERRKWLLMQGVGELDGVHQETGQDMTQERLERPGVFGMNETLEDERSTETDADDKTTGLPGIVEDSSVKIDWKAALSQSLRQSSNGVDMKKQDKVIIDEEEEEEDKGSPMVRPAETVSLDPNQQSELARYVEAANEHFAVDEAAKEHPLGPFPAKPDFPVKEYRQALAAVREHREKLRNETTDPKERPPLLHPNQTIPPEPLISNQADPRCEDVPVIPHDPSANSSSDEKHTRPIMVDESVRQVEEGPPSAAEILREEASAIHNILDKNNMSKGPSKDSEKKKGKRGRPRKDTQNLEA